MKNNFQSDELFAQLYPIIPIEKVTNHLKILDLYKLFFLTNLCSDRDVKNKFPHRVACNINKAIGIAAPIVIREKLIAM